MMRLSRVATTDAGRRVATGGRIGMALGFVLLAAVQLPGSSAVGAQDPATEFVELNGTGAGEINELMTTWAAPVYQSPVGISVGYVPKGDKNGRLAFSRGEADFVITGRPFTDEDRANLAERQVEVIEAPIGVSAITFLQSGPSRRTLITDQVDPNFDPDDPDAPRIVVPFLGPLKVPHRLVAASILESGVRMWTDPEFLQQFAPLTLNPPRENPKAIVRSDGGAMNYYVEDYLNRVAKDAYDSRLAAAGVPAGTVSESWPILATPSRTGDDAVAVIIGAGNEAGGSIIPAGGAVAAVSPTAAHRQIELQKAKAERNDPVDPPIALYPLQIPNGAGEWVAPTPETITAAAAAGNGTALYGLTEPVPGAYPLTWIQKLAAPSKGLTPEKATALATLVRYAVTEGQNAAAPLGEGRLPAALVTQALEAADRIVTSNCTGSDRTLTTVDGGGPNWPTGVAAPANSKICKAVVTPGVTTTTVFVGPANTQTNLVTPPVTQPIANTYVPPASPSFSGSGDLPDTSFEGDLGPADVQVEGAVETAETAPPTTAAEDELKVSSVEAKLPLAMPGDGRFGLDRLTTAALGGAAFLLVRGTVRKRIGAVSA